MDKEKKVTLKDIASSLNVSINTVSHALRDLDDISEKEKDRIRKEAIRLGYASKKFDLRYLKKYSVCLIFDSFLNPYFAYMGERLRLKLNDKGFDIVVLNTNEYSKVDENIIKKCINRKIDAIISFNEIEEKAIELSKINNIEIILIGRISTSNIVSFFYTDDLKGGELAATFLFKKKEHKLIYLYEPNSESSYRREEGFLKVVWENNIDYKLIDSNDIDKIEQAIKDGYRGIFFYNDEVLSRIIQKNPSFIKLLRKCTIVGYDNTLGRLGYNHRFASIDFDYDKIASEAIDLLFKKLYLKQKNLCLQRKYDVYLTLNEN